MSTVPIAAGRWFWAREGLKGTREFADTLAIRIFHIVCAGVSPTWRRVAV
jgi:hypothetical protein